MTSSLSVSPDSGTGLLSNNGDDYDNDDAPLSSSQNLNHRKLHYRRSRHLMSRICLTFRRCHRFCYFCYCGPGGISNSAISSPNSVDSSGSASPLLGLGGIPIDRFVKAGCAIAFVLCIVLYTTLNAQHSREEYSTVYDGSDVDLLTDVGGSKPSLILAWTTWFDDDFCTIWDDCGTKVFQQRCPSVAAGQSVPGNLSSHYFNCELSSDRSRVAEASSIIFHIPDLVGKVSLFGGIDIPRIRTPNQRYVFYNLESPVHTLTRLSGVFDSFFNLTMTYRRDSDIFAPYSYVIPIVRPKTNASTPAVVPVQQNMLEGKTKWVGWVVSRCFTHSRREHFVRALSQHINVDIYGRCGDRSCHQAGDKEDCFQKISREYRFYISIENSLCTHYITEKFYSRLLELNVVLVVLRPSNSSAQASDNYAQLVPPHSYIDGSSFASPAELATYLRKVGSDPVLFNQFFAWRQRYSIGRDMFAPFCDLCRMMRDADDPRSKAVKIYDDMKAWWQGDPITSPHCRPGAMYSSTGKAYFPAFNVPYFIHLTAT